MWQGWWAETRSPGSRDRSDRTHRQDRWIRTRQGKSGEWHHHRRRYQCRQISHRLDQPSTATDIEAAPGASVNLSVAGSSDPDGDPLRYYWWHYREASSYKGEVSVRDSEKAAAYVQVPADAKPGETLHLIAEVTDSGKPPITRYARVIITVRGK